MIRVIIADDHRLIREGIKSLIESESDIELICEVSSRSELEGSLALHTPDVLVLDISMEERSSGLVFLETHQDLLGRMKVLMLSMNESLPVIKRAIELGAKGYLPKSETSDCLLTAVNTVASGSLYLAPSVSQMLLLSSDTPDSDSSFDPEKHLTKREFSIFSLLGSGMSSRQIAEELGIRPSTVSTHMENMKEKLNLSSTTALTRCAVRWSGGNDLLEV